jgi:hypothetical protein
MARDAPSGPWGILTKGTGLGLEGVKKGGFIGDIGYGIKDLVRVRGFSSRVGSWQLAVGSWQLAVGSWQLAVMRFPTPINCQLTTSNYPLSTLHRSFRILGLRFRHLLRGFATSKF